MAYHLIHPKIETKSPEREEDTKIQLKILLVQAFTPRWVLYQCFH